MAEITAKMTKLVYMLY